MKDKNKLSLNSPPITQDWWDIDEAPDAEEIIADDKDELSDEQINDLLNELP